MTSIDTQVMLIVGSMFLCGAIIIGIASFRLNNKDTVKELWQLYAVEFALVSMVLVPIYVGGLLLLLATLLLAWRGIWEFYQIYDLPGLGAVQTASYISAVTALSVTFYGNESTTISVALLLAILIIFFSLMHRNAKSDAIPIAFTSLALPVLPLLLLITIATQENGFLWLFFIYVTVELNDSFAYLTGKIFGKHHPFPYLSPRKSTEGLVGGLIIASIIGIILAIYLLNLNFWNAAGITITCLFGGLIGDFITSALKRKKDIKDFPPIHGFHGGALDIHDAYLFAIPCFYLYYTYIIL